MKNERISLFIKSIIWGVIWLILAALIALIITKVTSYKDFESILFIEGLILIFVGTFCSISGDSMGISLQGLGKNDAQYITNGNLEVSKMSKEKIGGKINIGFELSTFSLVVGGVFSVVLTYII